MAFTLHSKYWSPCLVSAKQVFSHALGVATTDSFAELALLQSSLHDCWAWKLASSLETRLRYTPSDVFETFPFPDSLTAEIADLGERYSIEREAWCSHVNSGLTSLYNAFHDPQRVDVGVATMRTLLTEIDRALLAAYGWSTLPLEHGFHEVASLPANDRVRFTISEAARLEILRRLSALNRQRYQEEQDAAQSLEAAQAERTAPRKRAGRPAAKKAAASSPQTPLFE